VIRQKEERNPRGRAAKTVLRLPQSKMLLLGIFPRGAKAHAGRDKQLREFQVSYPASVGCR